MAKILKQLPLHRKPISAVREAQQGSKCLQFHTIRGRYGSSDGPFCYDETCTLFPTAWDEDSLPQHILGGRSDPPGSSGIDRGLLPVPGRRTG